MFFFFTKTASNPPFPICYFFPCISEMISFLPELEKREKIASKQDSDG
jgi:hypothetical protein